MTRIDLESLYREYFIEIRGFYPFPMELTYENALDFAEWLSQRHERQFELWLDEQIHGDEWLQPVKPVAVAQSVESIGHCLSYLEGMLLRQPENSCPAIEESLRRATKWYKAKVFEP